MWKLHVEYLGQTFVFKMMKYMYLSFLDTLKYSSTSWNLNVNKHETMKAGERKSVCLGTLENEG